MQTKFLVLMGPSGVGKNTVMHLLSKLDGRFVEVKPHVTRPLRPGENDRVSLSLERIKEMRERGEATQINHVYGTYYATLPKKMIMDTLQSGKFPMVDYKIPFVEELKSEFPGRVVAIYMLPQSFESIRRHLEQAGRTAEPARIKEDMEEVARLDEKYKGQIDFKVVNRDGDVEAVAKEIMDLYLSAL